MTSTTTYSSLTDRDILDKYKQTIAHLKEQLAILYIRINQITDITEIQTLHKTSQEIESELTITTEQYEHQLRVYNTAKYESDPVILPAYYTSSITSSDVYPQLPHYIKVPNYNHKYTDADDIKHETLSTYVPSSSSTSISDVVCSRCNMSGHSDQYHDDLMSL